MSHSFRYIDCSNVLYTSLKVKNLFYSINNLNFTKIHVYLSPKVALSELILSGDFFFVDSLFVVCVGFFQFD